MVAQARASSEVSKDIAEAKRVMNGDKLPSFPPAEFCETTTMGYVVEKSLWCATPSEFENFFGAKHTQLALPLEEVADECGKPMKVIVMENPNEPFRRLTLQNFVQTNLSKKLLQAGALLRAKQAEEYKAMWEAEQAKGRPKCFTRAPCVAELKQRVEKLLSEPLKSSDLKAGVEAAPLASVAKEDPHSSGSRQSNVERCEEDEEDLPEEDPELQQPIQGLAMPAAGRGRHGNKGRGRGRGQGRIQETTSKHVLDAAGGPAKKLRVSSAPPSAIGEEEPSAAASDAISVASKRIRGKTSIASLSPEDKSSEAGRAKLEQLSTEKALLGKKIKGDVYQATRALDSLDAAAPGSSEAVALRAKVDLVQKCATVSITNIHSLEVSRRRELVAEVCRRCDSLPAKFQVALVSCAVRDLVAEQAMSVEAWLQMSSPFQEPRGWLGV